MTCRLQISCCPALLRPPEFGKQQRFPTPSYRRAFEKRRCLIPADGFYEWLTIGGMKIPFSIGMKDDGPFVFAGLWEGSSIVINVRVHC
jgi:putative SOS response-associated peptidase YedK